MIQSIKKALGVMMCALFAASGASAAVVPFDEAHFPDPAFRKQIEDKVANPSSSSNKMTFEYIDGVKCLNTDKLTNLGSINSDVTDITGIKYFDHITSIDFSSAATKGLKHVDLRGMTKLTSIKYATYTQDGKSDYTATGNDKCILESMLLDGTNISELKSPRCRYLKHVSVRNCTKLTTINLQHCDLMGLDLTGCTSVSLINVYRNPNMTYLKLDENDTPLKYLFIGDTKISELNFSPQMTNLFTISMGNTSISKLDLTSMNGKTVSALYTVGSPVIWVKEVNNVYSSGTWNLTGTAKLNIGYCESFQIHEPGDASCTITTDANGSYSKSTGIFTFAEGKYESKITVKYLNKSYKNFTNTVTITREKVPVGFFIEYTDYNPLRNEYFNKSGISSMSTGSERLPLTHDGENEYSYNGYLMGNFKLVQVKEDGSEVYFGGNSTQFSSLASDMSKGYVLLSSTPEHALHMDVTTQTSVSGESPALKRQPQLSWPFTTHPDEANGVGMHMPNAKLRVHYVNGQPSGLLYVEGTPTGVDDITVDNGTTPGEDTDAQPVYFDLQGRRVAHPSNGIYIERRGTKVTKRLVH